MKAKNTIKESRTDWNILKKMSDKEVDFSDIPELDKSFFENAEIRMPQRKKAVSIRLDADVIDWFRKSGKGYQTKINAVLRSYAEAHQK